MKSFFIFDVESIGLHGEGFAVAGGVYLENGAPQWEFKFACLPEDAAGNADDREWVRDNVPVFDITHRSTKQMRGAFWNEWKKAEKSGAEMAVECGWPVEAKFLEQCVADKPERNWEGPYPLHEIASFMVAAGMDPMAKYDREPSEMPPHDPLMS